jgi:multidrug efflux pump subunit AcrB
MTLAVVVTLSVAKGLALGRFFASLGMTLAVGVTLSVAKGLTSSGPVSL